MNGGAGAEQRLQEGLDHLNAGRPAQALRCAQAILIGHERLPAAWFLAGLAAAALGQGENAVRAFLQVVRLDPHQSAAWAHLAEQCVRTGRILDAEQALAEAIARDDPAPNTRHLIAMVLSMLEAHGEALPWYERAAAGEPHNVGIALNQAACLTYLGELDRARRVLHAALAVQPGLAAAHWMLAGLGRARDEHHLEQMRALLARGDLDAQARAQLHYACGKELEDLEAWDDAFDAYAAGAAARRRSVPYDEGEDVALFDTLADTFTPGWHPPRREPQDDGGPAIFVVGQPRSGTTLVERLMTAHPAVHPAGELRQLIDAVRHLAGLHGAPRLSAAIAARAATLDPADVAAQYRASTARYQRGEGSRFVDKQLSNYLYLPLLLAAFPGARIVHVRRDPMDACFASFKQLYTSAHPHSYELGELARHHARYHRLMERWQERYGDRILEIRYEALVSDLDAGARRLVEYLGLPWDDACLAFHRQSAPVSTASAVQVREPVHTRSVGRWRRYARQLEPLGEALAAEGIPLAGTAGSSSC